jgi:transposase-like protein
MSESKKSQSVNPPLKSELGPSSRRYSEEFKRDAVRLVTDEKYSFTAAAKAVGVTVQSLREWHRKFVPSPPPCDENASQQITSLFMRTFV